MARTSLSADYHTSISQALHFSQVASSEASGQSGVPSHSRKLSMQQPSLHWNSVE